MIATYKIANKNIQISSIYKSIHEYCRDYRTVETHDFTVEISPSDIDFEREKSAREDIFEGHKIIKYPDDYLEELAVYRKIAEKMPEFDTLLLHGSAVAVDGFCYLFTAPSGTGKSTHTKLWCELLKDRAVMVNDDKPLITITTNSAVAHGTPFNGKHRLGNNISVPIKAICILGRSEVNCIHEITPTKAYTTLLQQTYRPSNPISMKKTLELIDKLKTLVKFYSLSCNMELEAAEISYNAMKG